MCAETSPAVGEIAPAVMATGQQLTDIMVGPAANAALCISKLATSAGPLDHNQVRAALSTQMIKAADGDLKRQETTLVAQSHTLDAMFAHMLQRAMESETMPKMEAYARIALKAQNQARMTIETLNLMKNPPSAMFVKQANVANGPQQINNGSRAGEIRSAPKEQLALEQQNGGTHVDFGATSAPIGAHSNVATLAAVKRPANGGR